jgi:multidrug resistance protein MdtO
MERTVALIPQAFSSSDTPVDLPRAFVLEDEHQPLLAPDAFTNSIHLEFAIRGMTAATLSYVVYTAIDWPGLSTAIATCIITALSTIGASRQKQFLRLAGALIGGIVFGMGAQVFVLPYLNSIAGFTVLFAIVTAISAWISTSTPRLSYLGVQMALAFYLINLQEFTIQTSLAVARDRIFGILLGLLCMWLVFDRLWVKDALQGMEEAFARNLELLAELMNEPWRKGSGSTVERLVALRDRVSDGFNEVKSQSDAVLFEFGPSRQRKLKIRDDVRRWQPALGTLLQVQVTYAQYLLEARKTAMPPAIVEAQFAFQKDVAAVMRALANEVERKPYTAPPDVEQSAATLRHQIEAQFGSSLTPRSKDIITLTQNLAAILAPLYIEIHDALVIFNQA